MTSSFESQASVPTAAIIVPAYNEERRIGPLLPVLSDVALHEGYLVVVACNGCTDATVELARRTQGLAVLEFPWASKPRALNEAERFVGDVFPRLYVDADVRTTAASLRKLVETLRIDRPLAVRPFESYLSDGAPWLVRSFYEARYLSPSSRDWLERHIEGHHIYGTNEAGRRQFDSFPEAGQMMEDAFFDRMFDPDQKLAVEGAEVTVPLPKSSGELLRARVRIYQGNWQLTDWLKSNRPDRLFIEAGAPRHPVSWFERVRHLVSGGSTFERWRPREVIVVASAVVVNGLAKRKARRMARVGRQAAWR